MTKTFSWTVYALEARVYPRASSVPDWMKARDLWQAEMEKLMEGVCPVPEPMIQSNLNGMFLLWTFRFPADSYRYDVLLKCHSAVTDPHKAECAELLKSIGFKMSRS